MYQATEFTAPEMEAAREAVEKLLRAHEPYPAILVDRRWNLVSANAAAMLLVEGVDPSLIEPPVNVLRTSLHPRGLAPRIINLGQWSDHIIDNVRRTIAMTGDEELRALEAELVGYARDMGVEPAAPSDAPRSIAIPMRLRPVEATEQELQFMTMIATFGTPLDITLAELALETFLPADAYTAAFLHAKTEEGRLSPAQPVSV